jgi:hypothetical protein
MLACGPGHAQDPDVYLLFRDLTLLRAMIATALLAAGIRPPCSLHLCVVRHVYYRLLLCWSSRNTSDADQRGRKVCMELGRAAQN